MSEKNVTVILLAGRMRSGKSTLAEYLKTVLELKFPDEDCFISGFAYGVKDVARKGFGWDGEKDEKGRRLLQVVGTEAGRAYDEDIWAKKAYEDNVKFPFDAPKFLIFDDWRFPNEYDIWLNKPEIERVVKIRCFREADSMVFHTDHASETSLPVTGDYYDFMFDNNIPMGSLLADATEEMLEELGI